MKMKLIPQQIQKQILIPSMQQSIEILLLPLMDLTLSIEQELQNNPLLEINEEKEAERPAEYEQPSPPKETVAEMNEINKESEEYIYNPYFDEEETFEEIPLKKEETLEENLLQELKLALSDPLDIKIGKMIIGNLDEDGYLAITCEEIAESLSLENSQRVESVLAVIQNFEPAGIASRNLKECLLTQAGIQYRNDHPLVQEIITHYLKELGQKKFFFIAKNLGLPLASIKSAAQLIAKLDPRPARNYRPIAQNIYIKPDVIITKNTEGEYQVHLNREGIPVLRVNPYYKTLLKNNHLTKQEEEFIREKMRTALFFMRGVEQRGQTIKAIAQFILNKQINFFENGHSSLIPMSLKDIAEALDRNESTISRAINNKYMDTPKGLFPMKFFFSQAIGQKDSMDHETGYAVSNRTIKEELKQLIDEEDKTSPLSDQEIVEIFSRRGTTIARRTISKYRQTLKILPTHLRKQ